MSYPSAGDGWSSSPETFADALQELKTAGCMVLVVENDDCATHDGCDRLLGADHSEDRRRLFVQTDAASSSRLSAAGRRDRTTERVARLETATRSTAAGASTSSQGDADGPSPRTSDTTVASDLDTLAADARDAVDALAPPDGFEPGQLRICMDALGDVVAAVDTAGATGLVADLRALVETHGGLGHVHVTQAAPGAAAEALLPQMDAVVEIAGADGSPRHRWHLPDESLTSSWLSL
ncbi:DUF7504 family protein [Halobacterium rubrum]|uniref:DUF7504 family protein n=1 Tax=Halobacterium TaxID=2239 RepID=UPI001F326B44|nr:MULTISPECIES: hypothetical protein [Halobacterium]MDH5021128.1 hypothetical protein [Halobacterium rubrum]